jgi:hypothetical protein
VETCGGREDVAVRTPDVERVEMEVVLPCAGMVVLSDNWFPGWHAVIDAKAAPVLRPPGRNGAHPRVGVSICVFLALGVTALTSSKAQ